MVSRRAPTASPERLRELRETATRLFREKGYEATTIQNLADAMGILKGSVYYYIDSKEQLLFDIVHESHIAALENLRTWHPGDDAGALAKLQCFIDGHLQFQIDHLDHVAVYYREVRALNAEMHGLIMSERREYDGYVRRILDEGKSEGIVRLDLDTRLTAIGIISLLNALHLWYRPEQEISSEIIVSNFRKLLLSGILMDDQSGTSISG